MKILKHSADLQSLALVFGTLFYFVWLLSFPLKEIHGIYFLLALIAGAQLVMTCTLINHNHRHNPIFYSYRLNNAFNILLSLSMGAPSSRLHIIHHWNHHKHFTDDQDASSYSVHAKGKGIFRLFFYFYSSSKSMKKKFKELNPPASFKKMLSNERLAIYLFWLICLLINPAVFLALILPGMVLGLFYLLMGNLANHDGCKLDSDFEHSMNFTNRLENLIFMNAGYHWAHHEKPHLHWTELKAYHEKNFDKNFEARLTVNSYYFYVLKKYLLGFG